jgi:hypothetical protein
MTRRYFLRCQKGTPGGRCNFLVEWHATYDAMTTAVAEHQYRHWDTIDWGEARVAPETPVAGTGGRTLPLQLSLWKGENA